MKKTLLAAIVVLLLATSFSLTSSAQPPESQPPSPLFSDHFDGTTIDSSKWVVEQNVNNGTGGSATVSNSCLLITSNGTSIPYMYTASNPFPVAGDFAIEFDIQYTSLNSRGTGIWISQDTFIPRQYGDYSNILFIWGVMDLNGGLLFTIFMENNRVYEQRIQRSRIGVTNSNVLNYRLQYIENVYTLFVNGEVVASAESDLRADTIGIGHPPFYDIPFSFPSQWTCFQIDSIRVLPPSNLSFSLSPRTESSAGNTTNEVDINGTLTSLEGTAIPDAEVSLSYRLPSVSTWTPATFVVTDVNGDFETTWLAPAADTFLFKAEWSGNEVYAGTIAYQNVTIPHVIRESLFRVESNSTLSALAFNSTSKEISFSVSGPNGTTGYVRFIISKTLMPNLDFTVYVDGNQLEFNASSIGDFQELYFTYSHSTHHVFITLDVAAIPEFTAWILLPMLAASVMIAFAVKRDAKNRR